MHEVTVFCGERAIPAALEEDWRDRATGGWTPLQAQAWREGLDQERTGGGLLGTESDGVGSHSV